MVNFANFRRLQMIAKRRFITDKIADCKKTRIMQFWIFDAIRRHALFLNRYRRDTRLLVNVVLEYKSIFVFQKKLSIIVYENSWNERAK